MTFKRSQAQDDCPEQPGKLGSVMLPSPFHDNVFGRYGERQAPGQTTSSKTRQDPVTADTQPLQVSGGDQLDIAAPREIW